MVPAGPRPLRILVSSAGLAALGLHVPASPAGEAYARFTVSATVEPYASLVIRGAPDVLTVTPADVARGYLDLPQPLGLRVQSNSRSGYLLTVSNSLPGLAGLRIDGLGDPVSLEAAGGSIAEHWTTPEHTAAVTLRLRLLLDAAVTPGTYPWPLHLSAAAL
jgi:hypothetical protein